MARIDLRVSRGLRALGGASLVTVLGASPAFAHHVMDGQMPGTFMQGLLSGFGHPVIGPDHFAFVIAIGMASTLFARGAVAPLAFVGATLLGCVIHLFAFDLPFAEPVIAISVLAAGVLLALRKAIDLRLFVGLTALAGLFHGYAYGESIVGAEPSPLVAYLIGFAVIQSAIALGAFFATRWWLSRSTETAAVGVRVAGGVVAAVGLFFLSSAVVA